MPVSSEQELFGGLAPQTAIPLMPDNSDAATGDILGAAFSDVNTIGQVSAAVQRGARAIGVDHTPDPTFDPYNKDLIAGYETNLSSLSGARNRQEFDFMRAEIDKERERETLIATSGWRGTAAALTAGLFDPINLIPFDKAKTIYNLGRAGRVGQAAYDFSKVGLGYGLATEGIRQETQLTRTPEESAYAIGGSTLLFGVLGATTGLFKEGVQAGEMAMSGKKINDMNEIADAMARESQSYADRMAMQDGGSVGAAAVPRTTLEQETLVPARVIPDVVAEALSQRVQDITDLTRNGLTEQDPTLRLATSESVEARRIIEQLADSPLMRQKNLEGIASPIPVESILRQHEANLELLSPEVYDLYSSYRKGRAAKFGEPVVTGIRDLVARPEAGKLTFSEWRQEVGKAMARSDTHEIPEVAQAAKLYRGRIFDPLFKQAISQGMLPAELLDQAPATAASYISRLYNKERIIAQRPDFERRITSWLKSTNTDITSRFDNYNAQADVARGVLKETEPKLAEARQKLAVMRPKAGEADKQMAALTREIAIMEKQVKRAEKQSQRAQSRAAALMPEQGSKEFAQAIKDLKNGVPKSRQPLSLSAWIRSQGGLKDQGGDVSIFEPGKGIINNKSGMTLDEAARRAQEAGFFASSGDERIMINDFLAALESDTKGFGKVVRLGDEDLQAHIDYLDNLAEILDKEGIDINKLSPAQIEAALSGKENIGPKDTVGTRARQREAEFTAKRAEKNLTAIQDEFRRRLARHDEVAVNRDRLMADIKAITREIDDLSRIVDVNSGKADRFSKLAADVHYIAGASDGDLMLLAREITDGLLGHTPGRLPYDGISVPNMRGPLKERTLLIPDAQIEDFLDRDIFRVSRHYNHTMSTDLELQKAFGRADMRMQIQQVNDNYDILRTEAAKKYGIDVTAIDATQGVKFSELPEELQKELKRLDKEQRKDIRDIEATRDRIRGTYGLPDNPQALTSRAWRLAKGVNFLRLMGGITVSSLPDVARPIMVHGLQRSFGDGFVPMIKNFRQFKLAASEAKLAGTALDMINNARALALAGLDDAWMHTSKFERGVTAMTDNFKFVSLIAPWTSAMKQFSAVISQTRSLEAIETVAKGGELAGAETARLAQFGIGESMAKRIWREVDQHGVKEDGVWWANTNAWSDKGAAQAYRSSIQREVDKIIVTPGQDKPLYMSRESGSAVLQFKSFAFASTQRMLISGLQQRDLAALNGAILSVALGMMTYWAKTDENKLSDKPAKWILEGLDRSGALAWFMDINNTMEKMTGYGINPMLGLPEPSRYASRDAASAVFGPTYGLVFGTLLPLIGDIARGQATATDLHKARQMLPYQNLFYIRAVLDAAEKGIGQSFGLPEKRQ